MKTNIRKLATTMSFCFGALLTGTALSGPDDPPPPIPEFDPGDFGAGSFLITNPYLPLEAGAIKVFEGETGDGFERVIVTVGADTRVVAGVKCRVVLDRAFLDGELIEETFDWFAQDLDGNVWYFGEESHEIEDGEIVSSEGSWEAGVDGARPGLQMLAAPRVGDRYRQELYAGEAEDMAEVTALDASLTLRDGTEHPRALRTLEWTPLEPGAVENKYYVAGVGLVRAEKSDGGEPIDLVEDSLPLKEAKLIIEHNATDEDTGFQGFIDSEGWQRLELAGLDGESILTLEALGELGELGMTELFFETVEPANTEVSIDDMLEILPEGTYEISGPTIELGESHGNTAGKPLLTHDIPEGPELLTPAEDAAVPNGSALEMSWEAVTENLEGEPVEIVSYQLIVEIVGAPHPHMIGKMGLSIYLPAEVTSVTLPAGTLSPDTNYAWEVLAIEESGNQTLSSRQFKTGNAAPVVEVDPNDPPHLKQAKLIIEHNATDEDTGFQGFVDSEGWKNLVITGPTGEQVLRLEGLGELGTLGLTELFFETVEPANADVAIEAMLAKLPAGHYTIAGASMQNGEEGGQTSGTALLTHTIPAGPELLEPAADAAIPPEGLTARWNAVTETIDGDPVNIVAYQLIVQEALPPHPHRIGKIGLSMYVPASVTSVAVPDEVLRPGVAYQWEVLAIEESGNQTLSSGAFATTAAELPDFGAATFSNPLTIDNPYWPLVPGTAFTYEGESTDPDSGEITEELIIIEVLHRTRTVLGIETRVVRDRVYHQGLLIEDTFDWYAQDDAGNVWYMGEEVTDFEYDDEGNPIGTSHPGAWEAGVDGALPGHIMKADPMVGQNYHQEFYPGQAVDEGTVLSLDESVEVEAGEFEDVVRILDSSVLFPQTGQKFFAPGIGLVQELDFDEDGNLVGTTELVSVRDPALEFTIDIDEARGRAVISVPASRLDALYSLSHSTDLIDWQQTGPELQGTGGALEFDGGPLCGGNGFFRVTWRRAN